MSSDYVNSCWQNTCEIIKINQNKLTTILGVIFFHAAEIIFVSFLSSFSFHKIYSQLLSCQLRGKFPVRSGNNKLRYIIKRRVNVIATSLSNVIVYLKLVWYTMLNHWLVSVSFAEPLSLIKIDKLTGWIQIKVLTTLPFFFPWFLFSMDNIWKFKLCNRLRISISVQ